MYSTHNDGKSVTAERFIKILKSKIYKKMTANDSKYYLSYLNKLVDRYNNTYNRSINSAWTENIESNSKAPKLKVNDGVKIY